MANDDNNLRQRKIRDGPSRVTAEEKHSGSNTNTSESSFKSNFADVVAAFSDFAVILTLVFGGCCS